MLSGRLPLLELAPAHHLRRLSLAVQHLAECQLEPPLRIPNNDVITSKMRFLDTMRAHEEATGGERFPYHPSSYSSERAGEKLAALEEADQNPEAIWNLKPSRGLGGNGIEMVKGKEALRE